MSNEVLTSLLKARQKATHYLNLYNYLRSGGMAIGNHPVEMASAKAQYERYTEDVKYYEELLGFVRSHETLPSENALKLAGKSDVKPQI